MDWSYYANLPAGKPPPGVTPNFDHPQSQTARYYIGEGICLGFAFVFVSLRVYVKLTITRAWGKDDVACLMGFAVIIAFVGLNFAMMAPGKAMGRHMWELRVKNFGRNFFRAHIGYYGTTCGAAFFVKLSLFLLYLRLFKVDKLTRWLIYGGILTSGLFYFIVFVTFSVIVAPPPGQPDTDESWTMHNDVKNGPRLEAFLVSQSVFNVLSDLYLLVLPIRSIFHLQLSIRKKLEVSSVFLIGLLAVACSLTTLFFRISFFRKTDLSWLSPKVSTFVTAEFCAGIICSCMPIIKVLFNNNTFHKSLFTSFATLLSRFGLRTFRQRSMSQQSHSFERLNPIRVKDHSENQPNNSIKMDGGIRVTKTIEVV